MKNKRSSLCVMLLITLLGFTFGSCGFGVSENTQSSNPVVSEAASEAESEGVSENSAYNSSENSEAVTVINLGNFVYTAFGDSISRGCTLDDPEAGCYPKLLTELIESNCKTSGMDYRNYSVDGQTSDELLVTLNEQSDRLKTSDLVTISTGANNILGIYVSKTVEILAENGLPVDSYGDMVPLFTTLFSQDTDPKLYAKVIKAFGEIDDYLDSDEFQDVVDAAALSLENDLTETVSLIREANPDAEIILQTIYNPYMNFRISFSSIKIFDISPRVDSAVSKLNEVVRSKAAESDCALADVYAAFDDYDGKEQILNARFSLLSPSASDVDVHPTAAGQKLIAETVFETLKEIDW